MLRKLISLFHFSNPFLCMTVFVWIVSYHYLWRLFLSISPVSTKAAIKQQLSISVWAHETWLYWCQCLHFNSILFTTGFADLSQDDQLILIKSGFFEVWLTWMTKLFNSTEKTLMLDDGSVIPKGELDIVYTVSIWLCSLLISSHEVNKHAQESIKDDRTSAICSVRL